MSRALLVGLLALVGFALVASATYLVAAWSQGGRFSTGAGTLLVIMVVSFLFLLAIYQKEPRAGHPRAHCFNCGRRLFRTMRPLDRRELMTCFSCGSEWTVPARVDPGAWVGPPVPSPRQ